jgi:hypothetical protein
MKAKLKLNMTRATGNSDTSAKVGLALFAVLYSVPACW